VELCAGLYRRYWKGRESLYRRRDVTADLTNGPVSVPHKVRKAHPRYPENTSVHKMPNAKSSVVSPQTTDIQTMKSLQASSSATLDGIDLVPFQEDNQDAFQALASQMAVSLSPVTMEDNHTHWSIPGVIKVVHDSETFFPQASWVFISSSQFGPARYGNTANCLTTSEISDPSTKSIQHWT
jgi:hypothetical protein